MAVLDSLTLLITDLHKVKRKCQTFSLTGQICQTKKVIFWAKTKITKKKEYFLSISVKQILNPNLWNHAVFSQNKFYKK